MYNIRKWTRANYRGTCLLWSPIGNVCMHVKTLQMCTLSLDQGDHFRQGTLIVRWLYYTGDHPREVAVHTGPTVLYR